MDLAELIRLARALYLAAGSEPEETMAALAWLARNWICAGGLSIDDCCTRMCALAGRAPGAGPMPRAASADTAFWRALAVTGFVWAGDYADPTEGATLVHRHDEAPAWAEHAKGTVLIGPWMFYRPR